MNGRRNKNDDRKEGPAELEILNAQVKQAHVLAPFGILASVLNSFVVFYILRDDFPRGWLTFWLVSIIFVSCTRMLLVLRFRKIPNGELNVRKWRIVFASGLAMSGALWGSLGMFPYAGVSLANEVFIAFVLGGMSAGAASSFSVLKEGYIVYAAPALTPLIIHFFLGQDIRHYAMGGMFLLYAVLLWRISSQHYLANRTSLMLRFENRGMIAELRRAKEELENMYQSAIEEMNAKIRAEEDLRQYQKQLEQKVRERTQNLRRVNEELEARMKERQQAEERRARAEQEVRRSEELYRTMARNMPDAAVTIVDRNYRFLLAEGNLLKKIGLKQDRVEGRTLEEAFDDRMCAKIEEGFKRALSGEPASFEQEYDGRVVWSRYVPVHDEQGQVKTAMNLAVDITDRKRAEREREQLIAELERSNRQLQQFAYVASHDLQEPLRTIASYVELLERRYRGRLDPSADKYITYVVEGANRMEALISDLLAYSRVATRARTFEKLDMNEVLKNAVDNLKRAIDENKAVVSAEALPFVRGDRSQLIQLLQNLISNAVKFRKKDIAPKIVITAGQEGVDWVFGVHDNGIGIDPRFYERVFLIFQRLHTREEYPGTGVGLAICKRIVERHGGRMWVKSSGDGTSFYFALPL